MMLVICDNCQARYEFDAATVPPEGYNAQCTACEHVFFVQPPLPEGLVAVSCSGCGAVYQFSPNDIPTDGYDAQCTQCDAVFFVSAGGSGAHALVADAAAAEAPSDAMGSAEPDVPAETSPQPQLQAQPEPPVAEPSQTFVPSPSRGESPEPDAIVAPQVADDGVSLDEPPATGEAGDAGAPLDESPATAGAVEADDLAFADAEPLELEGEDTAPSDVSADVSESPALAEAPVDIDPDLGEEFAEESRDSLLALDAELGEPSESDDGVSMEDDFETIMARKRKRRLIAAGALGGLGALTILVYFALPGVWDATVGPLVGIKARVAPEAVALFEQGRVRMLEDTDEAYGEAISHLESALELDGEYPEALAMVALAHTFRGTDIQERGRVLRSRGEALIGEMKVLKALPANRRPKDLNKRLESLRKEASQIANEATSLFELGGDELRSAERHLKRGLRRFSGSPLVVAASGIYLATDRDSTAKATEHLLASVKLYGGDGKPNLEEPPNNWIPYLTGEVRAADQRSKMDTLLEAYRSALAKEPRFQRARYRVAHVLGQAGRVDEARKEAEAILGEVEGHTKAKTLLENVESNGKKQTAYPKVPKKKKRRR